MTPLEKNDNPEVVKAVTDLIAKIKMGKLKGSLQIALETLNVLEEIISQADNANAYELVSRLRLAGGLLRRALPGRAPANVARRVLRAVRHETCAPDQSEAAAGESLQQLVLARPARRGTLGAARDLREPVRDHLAELRLELESTVSGISCQAAQHIDSDSVVLCALATPLAEAFLRAASRPYRLLLPEGPEPRQTHSLAARLSEAGVAVTVVSNAAVFAVMSRVTKVVVPAGAVLSGGGVLAAPGAHNVACAAHHHNVPVLVLCPLYKLCPLLPHAPHTYQELASPGGEVEAPASDFLTPDQVTLFLTNTGGSSPSYIYRTMSELYDPADNEL